MQCNLSKFGHMHIHIVCAEAKSALQLDASEILIEWHEILATLLQSHGRLHEAAGVSAGIWPGWMASWTGRAFFFWSCENGEKVTGHRAL